MLDDLDKTIERLLTEVLPIKNGEYQITFDQPNREWSQKLPNKPTINFFLYDVRENPTLRKHQWQEVMNGANGDPRMHRRKRTPFRLDCFYMLTVWAKKPEDEHKLLARCLKALLQFPILERKEEMDKNGSVQKQVSFLEGSLQQTEYQIQARVANHDQLTNPAEIWSSLDNDMRPSIPYVVTIPIDPWEEEVVPTVDTLVLRPAPMEGLPDNPKWISPNPVPDQVFIGGTVRKKEDDDDELKPVKGINVAIKGTGLIDVTDIRGRYRLGPLPAREYDKTEDSSPYRDYTVVVWTDEGKPKEKKITVHDTRRDEKPGDYDVVL